MQVSHFTLNREVPVTCTRRLGSVPPDAYVKDQAFLPNVPPPAQPLPGDRIEFASGIPCLDNNSPVRDQNGQLVLDRCVETVTVSTYNPVRQAVLGAAGSLAGTLVASALRGPVGLATGLASLGISAAVGVSNAASDELRVVTKEVPVYETKMVGYESHTCDGAYVPGRRENWLDAPGVLHYHVPITQATQVGTARQEEVAHSALGDATLIGCSFVTGLLSGVVLG